MANLDFSTILSALGGVDQAATASNPWANLSNFGDSFGQKVLQDAGQTYRDAQGNVHTQDPLQAGIAGVLAGLTGGISHEVGDNYITAQKQMGNQLVSQLLQNPKSVLSQPSGMDDSVFSSVGKLQEAKQFADAQKAQDEADALKENAQKAILNNPAAPLISRELGGPDLNHLAGFDPTSSPQPIPLGATAPVSGAGANPSFSQESSPGIMTYPEALLKSGGDPATARSMIKEQETQSKLAQTTVDRISSGASAIQKMNNLEATLNQMSDPAGVPEALVGMWDSAKDKMSGTSPQHIYNAVLPDAAVEIANAISRTGRPVGFQEVLKGLSVGGAQGPDTVRGILNGYKKDLLSNAGNLAITSDVAGQAKALAAVDNLQKLLNVPGTPYQAAPISNVDSLRQAGALPGGSSGAPPAAGYTASQAVAAGYSAAEISALQAKGLVGQ